jgi:hypothetical protein
LHLQVNWYAVLGNHDYGDKIDPNEDSCAANTLDACPEGCCYSSVWQVSAAAAAAAANSSCRRRTTYVALLAGKLAAAGALQETM